ncbi:hypothetical protein MHYP_G00312330 [Metynnis hypsauchen]
MLLKSLKVCVIGLRYQRQRLSSHDSHTQDAVGCAPHGRGRRGRAHGRSFSPNAQRSSAPAQPAEPVSVPGALGAFPLRLLSYGRWGFPLELKLVVLTTRSRGSKLRGVVVPREQRQQRERKRRAAGHSAPPRH